MSWDWEKTLNDVGESLAEVIELKYGAETGLKYAQEAQPLLQKTFSGMVFPLFILFIIGIVVLKWKS